VPQESECILAEVQIIRRRQRRQMRAHMEYRKYPPRQQITTITVVIFITFRALSLDSSMPLVFCHQK